MPPAINGTRKTTVLFPAISPPPFQSFANVFLFIGRGTRYPAGAEKLSMGIFKDAWLKSGLKQGKISQK
jgi:hypothetical protein